MDACSNAKSAFRLTRVLDQWFQRAAEVGAYLEYEIEGVVKDNNGGEERIAELLDVILPPVAENCLRLAPADRWISLHVSIQPQVLLLECSSAGKYYLESGVVCSKRLLNQAVGKSLRTHNLKPKKGAQVMRKNEKITALYERLSRDDFGKDDDQQRESNSISNQELLCRGWFLPPNTYDCGSFVVNGTAVVGKEAKSLITAANQHKKELIYMKSIFEQMGGTYRQEGDYLIPNLALPEEPEYQIGKYGRMRRSYLKEHRPVLYANLLTSGTLHRHLAEIDQACNERMEIIVSDMARQEDVTEALKAADQME